MTYSSAARTANIDMSYKTVRVTEPHSSSLQLYELTYYLAVLKIRLLLRQAKNNLQIKEHLDYFFRSRFDKKKVPNTLFYQKKS